MFVAGHSSYMMLPSTACRPILDGMFGGVNLIVAMTIIALPIGLCYIPAYRAVFSKDRYLKYFKQFEKEDEQWHNFFSHVIVIMPLSLTIIFIHAKTTWVIKN